MLIKNYLAFLLEKIINREEKKRGKNKLKKKST